MLYENRSTHHETVLELYTFYDDDSNKPTVINSHVGLTTHIILFLFSIKQILINVLFKNKDIFPI